METTQPISARYDEVAARYERDPGDAARRLYWLVYEHLTWGPVAARLPAGAALRVLDAGGGGGKYGVRFAGAGHHVTVLDLSAGMLLEARRRFADAGLLASATFVEGDVRALAFADESFDVVFCEGDPVSYCLDQHPRAMAELLRVALRGAPVVLGVDNRQEYFKGELLYGDKAKALDILLSGRTRCPYGLPVHTFTVPELRAAVLAAGGEVEEIFGKPVLFWELLAALRAARGPGFDVWAAREEILGLQERLAHEGYACSGGHLQVMARRR